MKIAHVTPRCKRSAPATCWLALQVGSSYYPPHLGTGEAVQLTGSSTRIIDKAHVGDRIPAMDWFFDMIIESLIHVRPRFNSTVGIGCLIMLSVWIVAAIFACVILKFTL